MSIDGMGHLYPNSQPNKTPKDVTNQLLTELLEKIFSELGERDIQTLTSIDKKFNKVTVDFVRKKEVFWVKEFVDFLSSNLKAPENKEKIKKVLSDFQILNFENLSNNLLELVKNFDQVKQRVMDFLGNLKEDDLERLVNISKNKNDSNPLNHLPVLVNIQNIQKNAQEKNARIDVNKIETLLITLLNMGEVEKAILITTQLRIMNEFGVYELLMNIDSEMVPKVFSTITNEKFQEILINENVFEKGVKKEQIQDSLLSILYDIAESKNAYESLPTIYNLITVRHREKNIFKSIRTFPNDEKWFAAMIVSKGIEYAAEFLSKIEDVKIRRAGLKLIVKILVTARNHDSLSHFRNAIPSESDKQFVALEERYQKMNFYFNR